MKNWFTTWFNTPYYHLLYKDRNHSEAKYFIQHLLHHLTPHEEAIFLDVACGKGRHSKFIYQNGFRIHGIDLSAESIKEASKNACDSLYFQQHDMRETYLESHFDYALNLFTSFGYFETDNDNQRAINAMAKNLKKGGKLIIDFMNAKKVILNLVEEEIKTVENIKLYCSGNKIKRIEKPIIGKPRNTIDTQIEEVAINFSTTKQNSVIGKISVINAVIRFSDKVNEPI